MFYASTEVRQRPSKRWSPGGQLRGIFFSKFSRCHNCQASSECRVRSTSPGINASAGGLLAGSSISASSSPAAAARRSRCSDGASATTASSNAVRVSRRRWLRPSPDSDAGTGRVLARTPLDLAILVTRLSSQATAGLAAVAAPEGELVVPARDAQPMSASAAIPGMSLRRFRTFQ